MLKILVVSHMFPRENNKIGGIFVHEQVHALRRRGIDARVISGGPFWVNKLNPRGVFAYFKAWQQTQIRWQWSNRDGVPVVFFPYLAGGFFRPWMHAWTYDLGLRSILPGIRKDFPYDLVHAHTSYLDGTAGLLAAHVQDVPLVITEHTGPFSLLTDNPLKRMMTRRAVKGANRVLSVGEALRHDMVTQLDVPASHITVLANGYDESIFNIEGRKERGNSIKALWVGHFVPIKRIDRLIEAFARVAANIPQLTLSLMGDGEGMQAARQDIASRGLADRIVFLDKSDRKGVAAAMRSHDFLVVSSETETFSLVTIEAFACGLPVMSTRCGGPEGLITDQGLGRLVSNDTAGLERGLREMCTDLSTFDPARVAAHAKGYYCWDGVARELTSIYGKLIEEAK